MPADRISQAELDKLSTEEQAAYESERAAEIDAEQAALPYKWRQTLSEVDIVVPVPAGTRGKQLVVEIKKTKLKVALKGATDAIIDGDLCKPVKLDDSTWTLGASLPFLYCTLMILDQHGRR